MQPAMQPAYPPVHSGEYMDALAAAVAAPQGVSLLSQLAPAAGSGQEQLLMPPVMPSRAYGDNVWSMEGRQASWNAATVQQLASRESLLASLGLGSSHGSVNNAADGNSMSRVGSVIMDTSLLPAFLLDDSATLQLLQQHVDQD